MSLNATPAGERFHIGLFGRRNAGKSSLINAITGQPLAVVSDIKGTTTDPVYKAMELLPLGPVMLVDTPGFDDEGSLGELRVKKAKEVLEKIDLALLVMDAADGKSATDAELTDLFRERSIPHLEVYTKGDTFAGEIADGLLVSATTGANIHELKETMARIAANKKEAPPLIGDLVVPGDLVVLVTPIDTAAPKGRLILPQQQMIRDLLDHGAMAVVTRETELTQTLKSLGTPPKMVVTDSQVFAKANAETPAQIPLTSFSILMARRKGLLNAAVQGIAAISELKDGDSVLICEGCTHHRQCEDIGSVKIPRWLREATRKDLNIVLTAGNAFPADLSPYRLIVHCGGCMLNERAMGYRVTEARKQGVPITNYGILIAWMTGILGRSLEIFPKLQELVGE